MATGDEGRPDPAERPVPHADRHSVRRLFHAFISSDSYGMVLLLILVTYVLSVTARRDWTAPVVLFVQIGTVWFALRTSHARSGVRLVANVLLAMAALVAVADVISRRGGQPLAVIFVVGGVLYVIAPFSIVRHLITRQVIDLETMLGAIAAYLLIGLAFAYVYRFFGAVQAVPFFGAGGEGSLSQDVFFSFTTLTTTGYGNLVPVGDPGQSLAVLEMIVGQLFLITAVGKIVSVWRPGTVGRERG
jgi:Ion channel